MCYNTSCHTYEVGALFVYSADVIQQNLCWAKCPLSQDNRPVVCVTTSARDKGHFVIMTRKNGKPCSRCGSQEWYKNGKCKTCSKERALDWQSKNLDKKRVSNAKWKASNREKVKEQKRRYHRNNSEKVLRKLSEWQRENPEKVAAQGSRRRARVCDAPGSFTASDWKAIVKHQGDHCLSCGKKAKLTVDHVIPLNKGGSNYPSNLQGLCGPCNSKKGTKTIDYRKSGSVKRWIQKRFFE